VDRAALIELIKASSGRSFGFEVYARLPQALGPWPGSPLLVKDVDLLTRTLPGDIHATLLEQAAEAFFSAVAPPAAPR